MAYTQQRQRGHALLEAGSVVHARPDVGGASPSSSSSSRRPSTTTGSRPSPGRSTASSSGLLVLTLAIGDGRRRRVAVGPDRATAVPVQRDRQDPDDRRARELPRAAGRASSIALDDRRCRACSSARRSCWCCSSRTSGRRWSSARSWPACCSCRARACAGLRRLAAASIALDPAHLDLRAAGLPEARGCTSFLNPPADVQGAGYQLYQSQIAVGSGGWFGKGLTNGTQDAGRLPAGPGHRLRVRDPRRGARLHRRDRRLRPVRRC